MQSMGWAEDRCQMVDKRLDEDLSMTPARQRRVPLGAKFCLNNPPIVVIVLLPRLHDNFCRLIQGLSNDARDDQWPLRLSSGP